MKDYRVTISWSEEDGAYVANDLILEACSALGATPREAFEELETARALWLETARAEGKPVPTQARGDRVVGEMTRRVVEEFDPLKVILFGSRARGDERPDSDVDLLVVFPQLVNRRQTAIELQRALGGFGIATDVVVTTPDEIATWGKLIGTVLEPALREGRVLYERG